MTAHSWNILIRLHFMHYKSPALKLEFFLTVWPIGLGNKRLQLLRAALNYISPQSELLSHPIPYLRRNVGFGYPAAGYMAVGTSVLRNAIAWGRRYNSRQFCTELITPKEFSYTECLYCNIMRWHHSNECLKQNGYWGDWNRPAGQEIHKSDTHS